MRPNKVKRALLNGEVQIGTWVNVLRTPQTAQMLAKAGFDFMYIDKEWIAKGIRLVPFSNEVSLLVTAGARAVGEIRGFAKEPR